MCKKKGAVSLSFILFVIGTVAAYWAYRTENPYSGSNVIDAAALSGLCYALGFATGLLHLRWSGRSSWAIVAAALNLFPLALIALGGILILVAAN